MERATSLLKSSITHYAVIGFIAIAFLTLRSSIILGSGSNRSMNFVLFSCIMFVFQARTCMA